MDQVHNGACIDEKWCRDHEVGNETDCGGHFVVGGHKKTVIGFQRHLNRILVETSCDRFHNAGSVIPLGLNE